MSVGPPKCKNCGVVEWRHVCTGFDKQDRPEREEPAFASPDVALPATTNVAPRPRSVTNRVAHATEPLQATPGRCTECEAKDAEIKELKRKLAEAIIERSPKVALSSTERARKHREAKRKAKEAGDDA